MDGEIKKKPYHLQWEKIVFLSLEVMKFLAEPDPFQDFLFNSNIINKIYPFT